MTSKQQLIDGVNNFYQKVVVPECTALQSDYTDLIQPHLGVLNYETVQLKIVYFDTVDADVTNLDRKEFKALFFVFENGENEPIKLAVLQGNLTKGIFDPNTSEISHSSQHGTDISHYVDDDVQDKALSKLLNECCFIENFLEEFLANHWYRLEEEIAAEILPELEEVQKYCPSIIKLEVISPTRLLATLSNGIPNEGFPIEMNKRDLEVAIANATTHK
ncbi:hypothetical protein CN918_30200 [Priestia megaterium]|nr:hypothetical protein CN918_30200 [Priestia megaterium]